MVEIRKLGYFENEDNYMRYVDDIYKAELNFVDEFELTRNGMLRNRQFEDRPVTALLLLHENHFSRI